MTLNFSDAPLKGVVIIELPRYFDDRGWFQESFKKSDFTKAGIPAEYLQDNLSLSKKGTLRGLHFQKGLDSQGKLVQVISGAVWDVIVDIRSDSPSFGKWFGIELSAKNQKIMYIPEGFAHGFVSLMDETLFSYKCTREYNKASESGIIWNDENLNIDWPIKDPLVSTKDLQLKKFKEVIL